MRSFPALLPALALVSAAFCADPRCPWLNATTAGGVLGGHVTTNTTQTSCEFIRREGSSEWMLWIDVETIRAPKTFASFSPQCVSESIALRGIGNEAVACDYPDKKGGLAEQVVGRVRDQAFFVRISTNNAGVNGRSLRDKARQVAEQIAGFLF